LTRKVIIYCERGLHFFDVVFFAPTTLFRELAKAGKATQRKERLSVRILVKIPLLV
jgi:hypothetical protein